MGEEGKPEKRGRAGLLILYWGLGVAAALLIATGGRDPTHRVFYFVVGNVFGIASTWVLMKLYTRMNANLATALANGVVFMVFQLAAWRIWGSPLTLLQGVGIATVLAGSVLATWRRSPASETESPALGQRSEGDGV